MAKDTAHENLKPFGTKIKVNTCTNFVLGRLKKKIEKSQFRVECVSLRVFLVSMSLLRLFFLSLFFVYF